MTAVLPAAFSADLESFGRVLAGAEPDRRPEVFALLCREGIRWHSVGGVAKPDVIDALSGIGRDAGVAPKDMQSALARAVEDPFQPGRLEPSSLQTEPNGADVAAAVLPAIRATPYRWVDPASIPPRDWLYDRHLIRRFLSVDVAAGAVGRTSLVIVEALSIVTGRGLLTGKQTPPGRVWIWNGEDPLVEMERRIQAACLHYGIAAAEIDGRLFVDTGRKMPIVIAREERGGLVINEPVVKEVKRTIVENHIDVFWVDPFIRSHRVPENDNGQINAVAEAWAEIADETNTAIDLVHHLKKTGANEISAEDARGASALVAAARSVRTHRRMTTKEAQDSGTPETKRKLYFRVDAGDKANLVPPSDVATWRRLEGVFLGNQTKDRPADDIGVVTAWKWPDAFEGVTVAHLDAVRLLLAAGTFRQSSQAKDWAGYAVAEVLGLDADDQDTRAKIKKMLKTWIGAKALKVEERLDAKREKRAFIVPTRPATDPGEDA